MARAAFRRRSRLALPMPDEYQPPPTELQIRAAIALRKEIKEALGSQDTGEEEHETLLWLFCLSNVQIHEMTRDAEGQGHA